MKKLIFLIIISVFALPLVSADCIDEDKDRFYADDGYGCIEEDLPLGSQGIEEKRCDYVIIDVNDTAQTEANKVYNPDIAGATVRGADINPNQIEKANNGIDEDCDGEDGKLFMDDGSKKDLSSVIQRATNILSGIVGGVSALVITWGGLMLATAGGNDQKTAKAKKAIFGAIIGAVVALSAYFIIGYFVGQFSF